MIHIYPTGWFAIEFSPEVRRSKVKTVRAFGKEIVLWRNESGELAAFEPHCPHLGAHLGKGSRVADGKYLECPYHGIQYAVSGQAIRSVCHQKSVKHLKAGVIPVIERNQVIYLWNEAQPGNEARPDPEMLPPLLDEQAHYAPHFRFITMRARSYVSVENTVDLEHFRYVHKFGEIDVKHIGPMDDGSFRVWFTAEADRTFGHETSALINVFHGKHEAFGALVKLLNSFVPSRRFEIDTSIYSMGISINTLTIDPYVKLRQYALSTPIDEHSSILRNVIFIERQGTVSAFGLPVMGAVLGRTVADALTHSNFDDKVVWDNMRFCDKPQLTAAEPFIMPFRKWASRFY